MNSYQAKKIPIENVLSSLGHKPQKQAGSDIWFMSPLREEDTPSFKVNQDKNTWYDFGAGEGGTIIDLICSMYNENIRDALIRLENSNYSVIQRLPMTQKIEKKKRELIFVSSSELAYPPLLSYLESRFIDIDIARKYTEEINYKIDKNGTTQKAIGFKNDWGSYEIRNKLFKSLVGKDKKITSINAKNQKRIVVFEGFFDFLSFACKFKDQDLDCGFIVMNSTSNKTQTIHALLDSGTKEVYFYLDNDKAGNDCFESISKNSSYQSFDKRGVYKDFEDYNAYYIAVCKNRDKGL